VKRARVIAFYLPQFHPIAENDEWWEPGFTEWTNVTKASSLYPGHDQPRLPSELGFYDLRLEESRVAQAALAREYGVEAFCYWHYWFGGRRLLQRPFDEVLASGKPDFPFCLAWANQTWTGIWHGRSNDVLVEQTYPGPENEREHFKLLMQAFSDPRYVRVDGKPLFVIYRPEDLPDAQRITAHFRALAVEHGLPGLHLVGIGAENWLPHEHGFDASILCEPGATLIRVQETHKPSPLARFGKRHFGWPDVYLPDEFHERGLPLRGLPFANHPCVVPNWDNTPRSGQRGFVFHGATPATFAPLMRRAVESVQARPAEERLVFVKSWNEWAEGNHLEPDRRFGRAWLEAVRAAVE
jgi:lipopolysaccharide biosynthesis protein